MESDPRRLCGGLPRRQFYFFLGQRYGDRILARFPSWKPRAKKVQALLRKYDTALVLGIRFLYGLRTVGPIVIGMSHVPLFRLVTLNAIGTAIWAPLIAGGGYLLGNTLELVLADVKRYEEIVLALLAFLGLVAWVVRRRRLSKLPAEPDPAAHIQD